MNTYYSRLGRILDERTPIHKPGYYVICEGDTVKFCLAAPDGIEIVRAGEFEDALIAGCKEVVRSFAGGTDNRRVYAFCLYTSEHKETYIYVNTLEAYEAALENYRLQSASAREKSALKYNPGDFRFQFWAEHMGPRGEILDQFGKLCDYPSYSGEEQLLNGGDRPLIAFEAGIVDAGYNLLFQNAMLRLTAEDAFAPLDQAEDFIAFASIGNGWLDYNLVMRKTINPGLFYKLLPDLEEADIRFSEAIGGNRTLTAGQYLDFWMEAVHDEHFVVFPYTLGRGQYDIFRQMEHLGNDLAEESLLRLKLLMEQDEWEGKEYGLLNYYVEALHFSGPMTAAQQVACKLLAAGLMERHIGPEEDDLHQMADELLKFAVSERSL